MVRKCFVFFFCFPMITLGGGFEWPSVSSKALGLGGAFAAVSSDASAVFYNPGAMSLSEMKASLTGGSSYTHSRHSFLGLYHDQEESQPVSVWKMQFFGMVKFGEKMAAGIGFYSPFGYHTRWDDDWEGRYVSQESELSIYTVQPSFSYALNEYLGIGAGMTYSFGKWEHRKAIPAGNQDGQSVWSGNGKAFGVNAGILLVVNDDLKAGLTYRSAQEFKIDEGDYAFEALPASVVADYPVAGSFAASLRLPAVVTAAVAYRFTNELLTTFEISYNQWSSLETVSYTSESDSAFDFTRDMSLENAFSGRIGAQFAFTGSFELRGGFGYDISPFNTSHLLPDMPDANKILFTMGAGLKLNEAISVDLTVGVENYFERQGNELSSLLTGTYKTIRYLGGLSLNYVL